MTDAERLVDNLTRLRHALAPHYDGSDWMDGEHTVRMECFNEAEVAGIKTYLRPDECDRVQFTWLTWDYQVARRGQP